MLVVISTHFERTAHGTKSKPNNGASERYYFVAEFSRIEFNDRKISVLDNISSLMIPV